MLFTRCPECDTTFRLTDETLKKANGQVRCGRCASVFNAYAELHDPAAKSFEPAPPERGAAEHSAAERTAAAETAAERTAPEGTAAEQRAAEGSAPAPPPAAAPPGHGASAGSVGSVGSVGSAAETRQENAGTTAESASRALATEAPTDPDSKRAADATDGTAVDEPEDAPPSDSRAISATEVERVLTAEPQALPQTAYAWSAAPPAPTRTGARRWAVAAALALVTLSAQAVHHFRSDIAASSTFGPWLTATYDALGATLAPTYDVHQYEILDWVATAEPNARGLGSLKITARIQNRGPLRQPYPSVQLRLKDRWEEAVGSRMFTPAEYLPRDTPRGRLMSPGETARAEIEVVDPGPDAYGFELDVCIEVEASLVTCGTDEIFL